MKYTWDFISSRRGLDINKFLRGVSTIEEAQKKFISNDIIPLEDEVILKVIIEASPLKKAMSTPSGKKKVAASKKIAPAASSKEKPEKPDKKEEKKYFRKVLSPKTGAESE